MLLKCVAVCRLLTYITLHCINTFPNMLAAITTVFTEETGFEKLFVLPDFKPSVQIQGSTIVGQVLALRVRVHCVHAAHAEAGILTQEYPSPV